MKKKSKEREPSPFLSYFFLVLFFLFFSHSFESFSQQSEQEDVEYVILLHGLARSSRSMEKLEKNLITHGYRVVNLDYPSTKHPIEYLAEEILGGVFARYRGKPSSKIHFVTHSLGGIILRYYLKNHNLPNLGRVVMLSPPNQGSEIVNHLKNTLLFKKINGPAGQQLGTDKNSIPLKLGPVDFELGVIAGNRSLNPLYSAILPGQDDGVVSVERAKVKGMIDFLVTRQTHTYIMQSKKVIEQVIHFLKHGVFKEKP